tara:strand:- start:1470 stop:1628 length:159 start_codon:yes stop_codon:yes gene_type:complete
MPLGIGIGIGIPFLQQVGVSAPPPQNFIITESTFAPPDDPITDENGVNLIVE